MTKWLNTSFWNFVARTLLRNRHWVLLCIALFTIFMASQWKYIRFTQTEANLLPADHKENIAYNDFLKKFGEEGNVIVFAVKSADVFIMTSLSEGLFGNSIPFLDFVVRLLSSFCFYVWCFKEA